jgi:hypothetical protein
MTQITNDLAERLIAIAGATANNAGAGTRLVSTAPRCRFRRDRDATSRRLASTPGISNGILERDWRYDVPQRYGQDVVRRRGGDLEAEGKFRRSREARTAIGTGEGAKVPPGHE